MDPRDRPVIIPGYLAEGLSRSSEQDASEWLVRLPSIVAAAEVRWGISIGEPFEPGGATSWVAPARTADGRHVVYKCTFPHPEAIGEADALARYDGDGAVRLFESQPDTYEMLVERCEPGDSLWALEDRAVRLEVAAGLMRRLWRPIAGTEFGSLALLTTGWAGVTMRRLLTIPAPWVTSPIERGVDLLQTLPHTGEGDDVLLHQDFHPGNVLTARREPWLVIDPKPIVGDPAFDPVPMLVQDRGGVCEPPAHAVIESDTSTLAGMLGVDPVRIAMWAIARCAEWTMWSLERGHVVDASITYTWARSLDAIFPD
ncbi:MAG TPA: aminoglycoside phosphotransferase family protein [Acidimicrobiia bacterium]|nr:aminoglycoside phosphotransferase family protein [Acidimicrobiia bacterium]